MENTKILIIDDDIDLTSALQTVLQSNQYSVSVANTREEGMEKLKADKPDLIILDVMMVKQQDGFEVARELKKNDEFKDIPILMLTAVEDKTGIDFKSEAGDSEWLPVDSFLDKPVEPQVLLDEVKKLLN
ncbi:MAG: response regulator [Planctomycetes bacterium]|nr:response regulator [Planctomycetota bacterium]